MRTLLADLQLQILHGTPADWELLVDHFSATCVSANHIKDWTSNDTVLSQVQRFILTGWLEKVPEGLAAYSSKKDELSVIDGCVLWGTRVVVPPPGRKQILEELHETHPGVSRMKSLARCYIWWPQMDSEIEKLVLSCTVCQETRPSPATAPLHPWAWPGAASTWISLVLSSTRCTWWWWTPTQGVWM